jgi:hypothetical protein
MTSRQKRYSSISHSCERPVSRRKAQISLCAEQYSFPRARGTLLQSTVISNSKIQELRLEDYSICTVHTDM